eukprot:c20524_g2_i3.p1 GENE.c20524_g2_i3~~c20524_g2_i3.p1  ORF type:complete len:325 (-),score=47.72 c20524_g2_i3:6-980(-)
MASVSDRPVHVQRLPLGPNVDAAVECFDWSQLTATKVLFYGMIPALIYQASLEHSTGRQAYLPSEKRNQAIRKCVDDRLVTDESVKQLLSSFITGRPDQILAPLHQLMDAHGKEDMRWIPFHFVQVLQMFADLVPSTRPPFRIILNLLNNFFAAKTLSGNAWKTLFTVVLFIRALSKIPHDLLPLPEECADWPVSYNGFFPGEMDHPKNVNVNVETFKFETPSKCPHIVVYSPNLANFQRYDLIVAVYPNPTDRILYGYQLKEGRNTPLSQASQLFAISAVICGQAASNPIELSGWQIPSTEQIATFFGCSGQHWTPTRWSSLK